MESVLLLTDEETRHSIVSKRFASILERQINYSQEFELSSERNTFVKSKFTSEKNYLWNKCKYFQETEESFYVKIFLETGRFKIGHQVFIEKTDQVNYF